MKGKFSLKTVIIIVILLLVGVLGVLGVDTARTYLSGASADLAPKNVLGKGNVDGKSATITWTTDKETMGVVEYGTTPASLLLRAPESSQSTSHSVVLSPLKAGTNYYFRIRVGEEVFDNNGIPYSFKTMTAAIEPTQMPTITVVPTVAVLPTVKVASGSGVTSECNRTTDYNKDKVVNSLDYLHCLKSKPTAVNTRATPTVSKCVRTVDYNKDGVVNSLDYIKCLQDNK
ncbi:MAG TPA: fibronectin type III domain-containing protein [Candidatus Woesebacteria bacterium]|nr:fibronectin type III domain-containing protein [Candidatus Woesebacteria bacterium]HPR99574.1 fibronectin type III domain-containing protein [Candidatus Woesebacteria bacterium]